MFLGISGCADGEDSLLDGARVAGPTKRPPPAAKADESPSTPAPAPPAASAGVDDPGPAPTGSCGIPLGELTARPAGYVAYVPKSYQGKPTRLLVGLHGCGDSAWNFAGWGVNPYDTRDGQDYIGISVDGASAGGSCWAAQDESQVLAAIDDIAKCVWVHKQKVVVAGFSSGGILAYRVGLKNADRFAGIMVLNASISSTGAADSLLSRASSKINIAHRAHSDDGVFPIGVVKSDWQKVQNAGFPITTSEVSGGHDGTTQDWTDWLIPQMSGWQKR